MTTEAFAFAVADEVASIVRPGALVFDGVTVLDRDDRLDEPLARAAELARTSAEAAEVIAAVRAMYRRVGLDPTKTRPSSEALLRRVRKGDALPRINTLVDIVNWCSLESQLPFGLYDRAHIRGDVTLRLGRDGEEYAGIRKDVVHVAGRLTLADDEGPFGNPTSDSARTMVTSATTRALVVIFAPAGVAVAVLDRALSQTSERVRQYTMGDQSERPRRITR
jgi:DNA/RNA-binding domain of Phe-tRNA-synthetase-like protein